MRTQRTERASIQALPAPGATTAAVAAAEQSERLDVPLLEAIVATDAVKTDLPLYVCAARAGGKAPRLLDVVTGPCAVLVGPEGGLTDDDLAAISAAPAGRRRRHARALGFESGDRGVRGVGVRGWGTTVILFVVLTRCFVDATFGGGVAAYAAAASSGRVPRLRSRRRTLRRREATRRRRRLPQAPRYSSATASRTRNGSSSPHGAHNGAVGSRIVFISSAGCSPSPSASASAPRRDTATTNAAARPTPRPSSPARPSTRALRLGSPQGKDAGIDADSIKDNAVNIIIATVMGVIAFAE